MRNLDVKLGRAAALALLGVPSQAGDSSGLASQLAMAAKTGGFSTLTQTPTEGTTTYCVPRAQRAGSFSTRSFQSLRSRAADFSRSSWTWVARTLKRSESSLAESPLASLA